MKITRPYPYQDEDVEHVWHEFGGRGLLAWEPGLGKTFGAYLMAHRHCRGLSTLIICPAVVKETWRRQARQHLGVRARVLYGRRPEDPFRVRRGDFVVANYDILGAAGGREPTWTNVLLDTEFDLVVADECQYIKNMKAVRSKAVRSLCVGRRHLLFLSGTPLLNRPAELFPTLNAINPEEFPHFWDYATRYCALHKNSYGVWDWSGSSNESELHERLLRTCMVRRRKADVLSQLPPITRTVVPVALPDAARTEYREAVTDFLRWLAKKSKSKARRALKAEGMVRVGYLKRLAAKLKLPAVKTWIHDFLDSSDRKLLVFGIHRKVLRPLALHFGRAAVLVDGSLNGRDRQRAMDRFNADPGCRLMFGNIDAAGVGWSCTSADDELFVEMDWVPAKHTQAESRPHGIGRGTGTGRPLSVNYMVAEHTIEEDLCSINQAKMNVVGVVLDGEHSRGMNLFDRLVSSLKSRAKKGKRKKVRT